MMTTVVTAVAALSLLSLSICQTFFLGIAINKPNIFFVEALQSRAKIPSKMTTTSTTISDQLSFLSLICGKLKDIKRTGWVRCGVPLPESDADHMHRCAMCALLLSQPADPRDDYTTNEADAKFHPDLIDSNKLLRMAVTHDLCEALAGDITPHCDPKLIQSKQAKEDAAMQEIQKMIGDPLGKELYDLWMEYEEQKTVYAIYCKDIDKFEMVMQAYEYEKAHLLPKDEVVTTTMNGEAEAKKLKSETIVQTAPLRGFFSSTNKAIKTPLFRRLDKELREKRENMLADKGWSVEDDERQQAR